MNKDFCLFYEQCPLHDCEDFCEDRVVPKELEAPSPQEGGNEP